MALTVTIAFLLQLALSDRENCMVVDIIRERVPGRTPPLVSESARAPFAVGKVCFDEIQQLVAWDIDDSYSDAYGGVDTLADLVLRGPLQANETTAPVAVEMGIKRSSQLYPLRGSSICDIDVISSAVRAPERFYVALYVHDRETHGHTEAGRSALMRPQKP